MNSVFFIFCIIFLPFCSLAQTISDSLIQKAIKNGIVYLQDTAVAVESPDYIVYDLLRRTHHLPPIRSIQYIKKQCNTGNSCSFYPFLRLIDAKTLPLDPKNLRLYDAMDTITLQALWSDKLVLTKKYLTLLEKYSKNGDYELTHSYLALIWLKENQHFLCKTKQFKIVETQFKTKLLEVLNNRANTAWYDIHSETLALLLYGGLDKTLVRPIWIADLLAVQQKNGGFLMYAASTESEAHPTVLALWVLLGYKTPSPLTYKWICR